MGEDYPRTLLELERRFSTEDACAEYLAALRWPRRMGVSSVRGSRCLVGPAEPLALRPVPV